MSQNLINEATVIDEVTKAVAATLNIDINSIRPENSLIKDLGAESLDFLDINYRLEQIFGVKMARHFILEHIEDMFGEGAAIDVNSMVTDKAVAALKMRFGENLPELRPEMDMDDIPVMITVQSISRGLSDILDSLPEKCASCSNSAWQAENGVKVKCGSCGEFAIFTSGDDLMKAWLATIQAEKSLFS